MRNPQSFQVEMIRVLAIRARTTGTVGDAATLAKYVAKVYAVSYGKACEACHKMYGIPVAEVCYAGRVSMYTAKNPGKDMLAVRSDRTIVASEPIPQFVPTALLAAI